VRRWIVATLGIAAAVAAVVLMRQGRDATVAPDPDHPVLALGSPAPDFALPGVDGETHRLADFAAAKVLAVVFQCNHCPVSQLYEARIQQLAADYTTKGVAVVAINPDSPGALRFEDLDHSDVGDSYEEMKIRALHRGFSYPYLYDGDTQDVAAKFGVVALPHVFIFDAERTLRYQGRIDDNVRESAVRQRYAREAIDALLAGGELRVATTDLIGCATKWAVERAKAAPELALAPIPGESVQLDLADEGVLQRLRPNGTGKFVLVNFWATWCGPCITEFPDLQRTYRMYRGRPFDLVTVSSNDPSEREDVLAFLQKQHASNRNLLFASPDVYAMQAAFDPKMPSAVPFTLLLAPNGDVLYQETGVLSMWKMRRAILANLPEDDRYPGNREYWKDTEG
jgi:thiol-disulfide isomerase/thioredoxin